MNLTERMVLAVLILFVLAPVAYCAGPPVPDFFASPTSGPAPLVVSFADISANSPTGWAWYFGDETYTQPWKLVNGSAGWSGGAVGDTALMPDGSIVLTGGWRSDGFNNDVWRSSDNGLTWTEMTPDAPWSERAGHATVAMPDGSLILMGGWNMYTDEFSHDVWKSADNGATWTLVTAHAPWSERRHFNAILMPDSSIVLMGGCSRHSGEMNDVWRSADGGATWSLVTAHAPWSGREGFSTVMMPDGRIILMGGGDAASSLKNDVWQSPDGGATWSLVTADAGWTPRCWHSTQIMPDGSIILFTGSDGWFLTKNDMWRSKDGGATWNRLTADTGWPGRWGQKSEMMPDSSILMMGGGDGYTGWSTVWRFMPAGSTDENPVHTYKVPKTYPVALQVYNAGGFANLLKTEYITVTGPSGNISVSSDPEGAEIFLDGKDTGYVSPFTLTEIPPGDHIVGVTCRGYQDAEQQVTVTDGRTEGVFFTLFPLPNVPEFPSPGIPALMVTGLVMVLLSVRRCR